MSPIPTLADWRAKHPERVRDLDEAAQKLDYMTDLCLAAGKVTPGDLGRHTDRDEGLVMKVFRWAALERVGATSLLASVDPDWAAEFVDGRIVPHFGAALALIKSRHGVVDTVASEARAATHAKTALERLDAAERSEGTISYWERLAEAFLLWEQAQTRLFEVKEELASLHAMNATAFREFWHRYPHTARMFEACYPQEVVSAKAPAGKA